MSDKEKPKEVSTATEEEQQKAAAAAAEASKKKAEPQATTAEGPLIELTEQQEWQKPRAVFVAMYVIDLTSPSEVHFRRLPPDAVINKFPPELRAAKIQECLKNNAAYREVYDRLPSNLQANFYPAEVTINGKTELKLLIAHEPMKQVATDLATHHNITTYHHVGNTVTKVAEPPTPTLDSTIPKLR